MWQLPKKSKGRNLTAKISNPESKLKKGFAHISTSEPKPIKLTDTLNQAVTGFREARQ